MEKYYILSDYIISSWEQDLDSALCSVEPSQDVIDAILDYAYSYDVYSPTLDKNICISIN